MYLYDEHFIPYYSFARYLLLFISSSNVKAFRSSGSNNYVKQTGDGGRCVSLSDFNLCKFSSKLMSSYYSFIWNALNTALPYRF